MLAAVTTLLRHHVPTPRTKALPGAPGAADDGVVRHQWQALLAAATSPAERGEINDVFGRAAR